VPRSLLGPSLLALPEEPVARHRPRRSLGEERRANIWESSLPALLRYEDRNSMAFSVEARTPFLDYRLVEMAIQLPATALIRRGWTKAILRDAAKGIVPESVRLRRDKLGFPTPERRWLVELAPRVRRLLADSSLAGDVVDGRALDAWLSAPDEQLAARPGLFRLISLALWLRDFPGRSR
jgi:asparagine synthase (glutamine-hydrolysing)